MKRATIVLLAILSTACASTHSRFDRPVAVVEMTAVESFDAVCESIYGSSFEQPRCYPDVSARRIGSYDADVDSIGASLDIGEF